MIATDIVILYGLFALSHLFIQVAFGHMSLFQISNSSAKGNKSVAVIIPEYNEEPMMFEKNIESCLNQDFKGKYHIVAVDDGSRKKEAITLVKNKYGGSHNLTIIEFEQNMGKRHAQKAGFDLTDKEYDYIVTIDSDTILESDAISKLIMQFSESKVGAITGQALVYDRNHNLLTRLIYSRYWAAFNQERAAQSLFGCVLCATGVISAYRSEIIQKLKERYVAQRFMGQACTYGDDRHLTNLVLEDGYKVVYEPEANGWTDAPKNIIGYLKQQLRWNRSFYRELLITAKMLIRNPRKYPLYMIYDLAMQAILPILLLLSVAYMAYRSVYESPIYFIAYIGILAGVSLLRSVYAISRTGDNNFYLFPLYALIHIFLLVPLRLYAIASLKRTEWGTR